MPADPLWPVHSTLERGGGEEHMFWPTSELLRAFVVAVERLLHPYEYNNTMSKNN